MPVFRKQPADEPKAPTQDKPTEAGFLATAFGFFGDVLTAIKTDRLLALIWGVEVLLFAVLAFMVLFGGLEADRRFNLALVIVGSVVVTFLFSVWWQHRYPGAPHRPPAGETRPGPAPLADADLAEQARRCLDLLTQIRTANLRNISRGRAGSGPWAQLQRDTYNHVCHACHQRRLGGVAADGYFDTICAEPDVAAVCDSKWLLGEALEVYRARLSRHAEPSKVHDELELLIRRSVTQPDRTPVELEQAVREAIDQARQLVG